MHTLLSPEFLVNVDNMHFEKTREDEMVWYENKETADRVCVRGTE